MNKIITAGVLIIGDEILSGRTVDKNVAFLASQFSQMGIILTEVAIIPDHQATIIDKVKNFSHRFDYVVTTGGIGPTHDDITVEAISKALGLELISHPEIEAILNAHYGNNINQARLKMAKVPLGATLINSEVSVIPSFMINNILVLAGIPKIMQSMFLNAKKHLRTGKLMHNLVIRTQLKEGDFSTPLSQLQKEFDQITIGSYPVYGEDGNNHVDLVLRGYDKAILHQAEQAIHDMLLDIDKK